MKAHVTQSNTGVAPCLEPDLAVNRVLRSTYFLLGLTFLSSVATAVYATFSNAPRPSFMDFMMGVFGLYFLPVLWRNSAWGVLAIFVYMGVLGYIFGSGSNYYAPNFNISCRIIAVALGMTGLIFLGLSAYVQVTCKNLSYLRGVIITILVSFLAGLGAEGFHVPALRLLISVVFAAILSECILCITNKNIYDGERNCIMAVMYVFSFFIRIRRLYENTKNSQ